MANELKHKTVGTTLTQAEWEAVDGHALDGQAAGDIIYAADGSVLRRLAVGSTGQFLGVSGGLPSWESVTLADLSAVGQTEGDLLAYQSGEWSRLPLGGDGQVVGNNGGSLEYVDPRQAGDGVGYTFGTDADARWIFDSASNEFRLQTKDAVGAWTTRLVTPANAASAPLRAVNGLDNTTLGAVTPASIKGTTIEGADTTDATSTTAGALKTAGGLAVAKAAYIGGKLDAGAMLEQENRYFAQTIQKSGVIDNTLTDIARITLPASYNGTVAVEVLGIVTNRAGETIAVAKTYKGCFAIATHATTVLSAVTEVTETASAALGPTDIGAVTMTVNSPALRQVDIRFQCDMTGTSIGTGEGKIALRISCLFYPTTTTPPTIVAL